MTILHWLDQIQPSEQVIVGEKAFLLSRLIQEGYPVLPGFVINTTTFQAFLEKLEDSQSILADFPQSSLYLDIDNPKALQLVAQNSHHAILQTPLPSEWLNHIVDAAKQLDATALIFRISLALPSLPSTPILGLFSSQVCWPQPAAIELALKTAWSELFKAKSLFYWQRLGVPIEKVNLAILVQPLTDVRATGKVLIRPSVWQIQAAWGLGYSLVNGEVSPDIYEIHSLTGQIQRKQLGVKSAAYQLSPFSESNCLELKLLRSDQQESYCLDESLIDQLFHLTQQILAQNNTLKEIEWSLQNSQFYILQGQVNSFSPQPQKVPLTPSNSVIKGLGAASGMVIATLQVLTAEGSQPQAPPVGGGERLTQLSSHTEQNLTGFILVAKEINLALMPLLKQASGVILEQGGMTSHGAIIARELGIPAVVGVPRATHILSSGETILLDGNTGKIYRDSEQQLQLMTPSIAKSSDFSFSSFPLATQLMVNISQASSIEKTAKLPIDGVGLLRSEWMLSELLSIDPLESWLEPALQSQLIEELRELIRPFVQNFYPRPVFYRSFDVLEQSILGKRGTYRYTQNSTLFDLELQALKQLQNQDYDNLKLILPFVRSVEEFRFCQQRIIQAGLTQSSLFQVWIMAEVPSILFLLPEYVKAGVQGIAIGTNDLTQLLLGSDRDDAQLSQQYNARHPAMLMALKQLIQQAKSLEIPCSICGQATAQYPELIDDLIEWGITTISVEPEAIATVYQTIVRTENRLHLEVVRQNRHQSDYHTGSE